MEKSFENAFERGESNSVEHDFTILIGDSLKSDKEFQLKIGLGSSCLVADIPQDNFNDVLQSIRFAFDKQRRVVESEAEEKARAVLQAEEDAREERRALRARLQARRHVAKK